MVPENEPPQNTPENTPPTGPVDPPQTPPVTPPPTPPAPQSANQVWNTQAVADALNALPEKVASAVKEAVTPPKPPPPKQPDTPPANDKNDPGTITPGKDYKGGSNENLTFGDKFRKWWIG